MTLSLRFALFLVFPLAVNAHAILLSSTPTPKQAVKGPDLDIQLNFNSRIDAKRSQLTLITPDRTQSSVAVGRQPSPQIVKGKVSGLKHGSYVLRWQVLANDGHITRGEIPFNVE